MARPSFSPLRHRAFRLLWLGSLVSNIGTWMETVALGRYVADETGKAAWSGLIAAAAFLPTAFVGLIGGALADRASRRMLLIGSNLVQAVIALGVTLLVAGEHATPGLLTALTLVAGSASAIGFPSFQAALPDLVPPEELPGAIGLSSVQWNLGRVVGPVLAGLAIVIGGIPMALGINALSFLAVVGAVALVAIPRPPATSEKRPIIGAITEGFRIVRTEPGLRMMNTTMCVNTFIAAPFIGLIPAMVNKVLHAGKGANAALVTAQGVGAVLAGVAIGGAVGKHGIRRVMLGAIITTGLSLVAYGLAPGIWLMTPALAVVGLGYMASLSSFSTIAQLRAPGELRGRVMSVNNAVLGLLYPAGLIVHGLLADRIGMRQVTAGSGVLLLVVLAAGRALWPGVTDPIAAPVAAPAAPG